LAFAPLRQLVWQVGAVFFSSSAAEDEPEKVRVQLLKALRVAALVFFPLIPPAMVLAPVVLPAVLGDEWQGMVRPFQVLMVVGVGHALVNIMGEFLAGRGHVRFRARVSAVWAAATVILMCILVPPLGILGAAVTHAVLFVPVAGLFAVVGGRLLGVSLSQLAAALRPVVVVVVLEIAITASVWAVLSPVSITSGARAAAAAVAGAGLAVVILGREYLGSRSLILGGTG